MRILLGNALVVQWLGLCAFPVQGLGLIPGQELRSRKSCGIAKINKIFLLKKSAVMGLPWWSNC